MRLRILAAAFSVCLILGSTANIFAQWGEGFLATDSPTAQDSADDNDSASSAEDVAEAAADSDDDADEESDVASEDASGSEAQESVAAQEPEEDAIPLPSFMTTAPAAEPEPVVEEAPVVAAVPVKEKPVKAAKPVKAEKYASDESEFRYGIRSGMGVSAFQGHKAIHTESFGAHAIVLGALVSASVGLVFDAPVTDDISVTWGLQYSLYTAHGEFSYRSPREDFGKLNIAGVELHAFEMPILLNINIGDRYYAEVGPQFGYNLYGKIYANNDLKKPYLNSFAVGPVLGGGVKLNDDLELGVRGYFSALEYAENSNGRPWSVQVSLTSFFGCNK